MGKRTGNGSIASRAEAVWRTTFGSANILQNTAADKRNIMQPHNPLCINFASALDMNRDIRLAEQILVWAVLNYGADKLYIYVEERDGTLTLMEPYGLHYAFIIADGIDFADEGCGNIWRALAPLVEEDGPPPLTALDYPLAKRWAAEEFQALETRFPGYCIEYGLRYYQLVAGNIFLDKAREMQAEQPANVYTRELAQAARSRRNTALSQIADWQQKATQG